MSFGINDILIIFFIAFCIIILKKLWYSNALFGKYILNNMNCSFVSLLIETLIKTITVYILTMNMYYLLPSFFFSFVLLIILLVVVHEYSNILFMKNNTKIFFINSSFTILSLMLSFVISLITKS